MTTPTIEMHNGARVLYAWLELVPEEMSQPHRGLVLAIKGEHGPRPELVVWNIYKGVDDETWFAEHGDYFPRTDVDRAMSMFGTRLRRNIPLMIFQESQV